MRLIRNKLIKYIYRQIKGLPKAYIPRPDFPTKNLSLNKTLLITCSSWFNQEQQTAGTLMREGFARGWAEVCGPAKLIPTINICQEIDNYEKPAIFMSEFEFNDLSFTEIKKLRDIDLFVWVGTHPRKLAKLEKETLIDKSEIEISLNSYAKIMFAEPKFVWNAYGEAAREWYQGWIDDGLKWETIYPAVDTSRYYPEIKLKKYGHISMAYVGGYWEEKAQAFEKYLRPWENVLYTFGYTDWPYENYSGRLTPSEERQLYSSVGMVPLVTTPAGNMLAEITERYLKAPACKAFCIADENPALREIFNKDEMIQAENAEHFQELVKDYLNGKIDIDAWKENGYKAVQERHLYKHRALQIKNMLDV
ncbi:MAG: hypothetical protein ACD_20C00413G0013 [uncultured bacterium]|nr:MAG: hypothetical protein ACD_20C00413G0013 [uncultured bacterium]